MTLPKFRQSLAWVSQGSTVLRRFLQSHAKDDLTLIELRIRYLNDVVQQRLACRRIDARRADGLAAPMTVRTDVWPERMSALRTADCGTGNLMLTNGTGLERHVW
jgi:hypothetical protein